MCIIIKYFFLHNIISLFFLQEVTSQSSQPSSGLPYPADTDPSQPPHDSSHSSVDGSFMSPSVAPQSLSLSLSQSPQPSLNSKLNLTPSPVYDPPPIQHSPWTESSLDQPFQKSKKSRSSSKTRYCSSSVMTLFLFIKFLVLKLSSSKKPNWCYLMLLKKMGIHFLPSGNWSIVMQALLLWISEEIEGFSMNAYCHLPFHMCYNTWWVTPTQNVKSLSLNVTTQWH